MWLSCLASIVLVLSSSTALRAADDEIGRPYLALGDSISFGFIANAGFEYLNPNNFIGFPNYVGQELELNTSNAACPGETSASFLSLSAPDNGCRLYRSLAPLHLSYTSTQLGFAASFLLLHPETKLVTIGLGADDVLLLRARCSNEPVCIAKELPQVLAAVQTNLLTILSDLRATGFNGIVVVVNYYSVNYADANETALTAALNQTLRAASTQAGVPVADVFTAFQNAARTAGGHTCNVGLLNASPENQFSCDIHASQSGHQLIGRTVVQAYVAAGGNAP